MSPEPETLTTICPTTNKPILTRSGLSPADLSVLPRQARTAFKSYSTTTTLGQRRTTVTKALSILASKEDELAHELTEQMGRPIAYTGIEIKTAVKRGQYLCRVAEQALGDTPGEEERGFRRWIGKRPVGVVLVIFAWNVSLLLFKAATRLVRFSVHASFSFGVHRSALLLSL